jgi:hypothetical protein
MKFWKRSELGVEVFYYDKDNPSPDSMLKPLTKEVWDKYVTLENYYCFPYRIAFVITNPTTLYLPEREREQFEVTILCSFKLNRFEKFTIQATTLDRDDDFNFEDVFWAIWFTAFFDFNWNAPNLLIKPQTKSRVQGFEYFTQSSQELAPHLTNEDFSKLGFTPRELSSSLLACRYLKFVDFFNGNETLNWLSVAPVFEKPANYTKFLKRVVYEETRVQEDWELAQKQKRNIKTYLNRCVEQGLLERFGSGSIGGKLTDKTIGIITKYLEATSQPFQLLDSLNTYVEVEKRI